MYEITDKRIEWHLNDPVCATLTGLVAHLNCLPIPEIMALTQHFDCDSVVELGKILWGMVKNRRRRPKVTGQ